MEVPRDRGDTKPSRYMEMTGRERERDRGDTKPSRYMEMTGRERVTDYYSYNRDIGLDRPSGHSTYLFELFGQLANNITIVHAG